MELALFVYLANILPNLQTLLSVAALIIIAIAAFTGLMFTASGHDDSNKTEQRLEAKNLAKNSFGWIPLGIVLAIVAALIPSSKTMYIMAGAYAGQTVVTSEPATEMFSKTYQLINNKLDEYLEEEAGVKATSTEE